MKERREYVFGGKTAVMTASGGQVVSFSLSVCVCVFGNCCEPSASSVLW